ncbi:Uncharacterised protein [Mycobacteroides abscessus subsp. abscessus]|nr:Uncharacterised protein [Mycobacteroides abscessus subsp. abscessus]SKV24112.1 Uncharacterised protein [Mycobacteroides abscessus subsp. abscessus]
MNSSATTKSVGIGGRSCPAAMASSYSRTELKALPCTSRPACLSRFSRRATSPRSVSAKRSARERFSAMLEITATTCGKSRKMSAPASPLKSA